jgi:hypothetical protein
MKYEYLIFDFSKMRTNEEVTKELNILGEQGWKVVFVNPENQGILLTREKPVEIIALKER